MYLEDGLAPLNDVYEHEYGISSATLVPAYNYGIASCFATLRNLLEARYSGECSHFIQIVPDWDLNGLSGGQPPVKFFCDEPMLRQHSVHNLGATFTTNQVV